jgi:hypothetical protein
MSPEKAKRKGAKAQRRKGAEEGQIFTIVFVLLFRLWRYVPLLSFPAFPWRTPHGGIEKNLGGYDLCAELIFFAFPLRLRVPLKGVLKRTSAVMNRRF